MVLSGVANPAAGCLLPPRPMGRSVQYSSPSTIKRNYKRLVDHLHKLLNQTKYQVVHPNQPVAGESNELVIPVKPSDKPQQKINEMNPQTSKPMTLQDLKDYMSSTKKRKNARENELAGDIENRKKEQLEDLEKLTIMLGLPP